MEYKLQDLDLDLFMMGRPWLSIADFSVPMELINEVFNKNLQAEIFSKYFLSSNFNLAVKEKANKLKKYYYENVLFDNYGEPLLDKQSNKIIGYKLNETEHVLVNNFFV